jgi:CheY-like chemotaxis protein
MAEMLNRPISERQRRDYSDDIRRSSNALLSIINDILDFSKVEAGKLDIINTNFDLPGLLDELYSVFKILFANKNLSLEFIIDENVPKAINNDENRIKQVLTNLLSNALKYTPEGVVTFRASFDERPSMLIFSVTDSGIGISEESLSRLFRPFEQFDTRKNRNVVGTGLGLAISYRLCAMMGGDLSCESVYGEGSTFTVTLPCVIAEAMQHRATDEAEQLDFIAPDAQILVVDDIEINLAVAEALLSTFEIVPTLVNSGRNAVSWVTKKRFDIIFMDHLMPEMDGVETARAIQQLGDKYNKAPIIALTANAINEAKQMFLENGFSDFLPKPLNINALAQCLKKWLPKEKIQ